MARQGNKGDPLLEVINPNAKQAPGIALHLGADPAARDHLAVTVNPSDCMRTGRRSGGGSAASQALMTFLRRIGITDRRKVVHSIRHSIKQALRDAGCPKDVRDAIQGHSSGDVAETYGSGHAVLSMAEWLERASRMLLDRQL